MKLINPIGRKVETVINANSLARACMCKNDDYNSFSTANTTADTCEHCGCDCASDQFSVGNYRQAKLVDRTSSWG